MPFSVSNHSQTAHFRVKFVSNRFDPAQTPPSPCFTAFSAIFRPFPPCIKPPVIVLLSERTEAWNIKGALTKTAKNTVTFEDHATIIVDVGTRKLKSGDKVVVWDATTKPKNLESLKFKPPAGMGGEFVRTPDGLCFARGLCVFIR